MGIRDAHHFERSDDNSISMSPTSTSVKHATVVSRRPVNPPENEVEETTNSTITQKDLAVGKWIAFMYEGEEYRGIVRDVSVPGRVTIASLEVIRVGTYKWPAKEDILDYSIEDIIGLVNDAVPVGCGSRLQLRLDKSLSVTLL